jgi:hypothetical protein
MTHALTNKTLGNFNYLCHYKKCRCDPMIRQVASGLLFD